MKRKIFGVALSSLLYALCAVGAAMLCALCFSAEAQQPKNVPRIGILMSGSPEPRRAILDAFRQGLRDLGYVERKK
jgi:hypothetical protein